MTDIDDKIKELLNKVLKQKADVAEAETTTKLKWLTNCSFLPIGGLNPINIQTANVSTIVCLYADLLEKSDYFSKAGLLLMTDIPFDWGGYSIEAWESDFKKRIAVINSREQKDKLEKLETKLNALVSPDRRREMEVEAISKILEA
jgi:hypothetical protein